MFKIRLNVGCSVCDLFVCTVEKINFYIQSFANNILSSDLGSRQPQDTI